MPNDKKTGDSPNESPDIDKKYAEQLKEIEALRIKVASLSEDNESLTQANDSLSTNNASLSKENSLLKEVVKELEEKNEYLSFNKKTISEPIFVYNKIKYKFSIPSFNHKGEIIKAIDVINNKNLIAELMEMEFAGIEQIVE